MHGGRVAGELLLGVALCLAGVLLLIGTSSITVSPAYARVGPRVFPFLVAVGLIAVGVVYAVESSRGRRQIDEKPATVLPVVVICAAMILDAFLFDRLGFILSSTLLFALVAAGFGSRHYFLNIVIGLVLSGIAYVLFVYGLGLNLPGGILAGWS
jgi:putative tricarboxylic transport membrane protein